VGIQKKAPYDQKEKGKESFLDFCVINEKSSKKVDGKKTEPDTGAADKKKIDKNLIL